MATVTGLVSVWLARRAHVGLYPVGLVSTLLLAGLCLPRGLYAHALINLWYSLLGLYGWWRWSAPPTAAVTIGPAPPAAWGLTFGLMLAAFLFFHFFPPWFGLPPLDARDTVSSSIAMGAMYLMAARHTEHWLLWVVANTLFTWMFYDTGYPLIALQYLIFIVLAVSGWFSWRKKEKSGV